ncbi:SDR family NAD(P)-dependent oxidoreductase [Agrococcus versicolor]|uniref:SDR family NAD(P)-dependent oxidoreductase n=1 Tax=Agrococcus versicolor TaxID=501482 RepID=A0ABP5MBJ8_9MICO
MTGRGLGLDGAVVLVTGAASGIGAAVAAAAAGHGATPVLVDRDGGAVAAAAARIDGALALEADVTDEDAVREAIRAALAATGRIDALVTCAGVSGPFGTPLEATSLADWRHVLEVNVTGTFLPLKHAMPALRASAHGAAVLLASDSAHVAAPGMVPYGVSKAAVVQLARAVSVEVAGAVRVTALCPSIVDTPMSRRDLGDAAFDGAGLGDPTAPVHRAEDVAEHVLFLASPRAVGIHGTAITADFGFGARSSLPA